MTIRHLLTHTSGIGYSFSSPMLANSQATARHAPKPEWEYPLLHEPGEKWTYGASTRVLGLIVEKITGEQLENYYQRRIFKPLGMNDTSWAVAADKQSRVPTNHRRVMASGRSNRGSRCPRRRRPAAWRWRPVFHCARLRPVPAHAAERRQARVGADPEAEPP